MDFGCCFHSLFQNQRVRVSLLPSMGGTQRFSGSHGVKRRQAARSPNGLPALQINRVFEGSTPSDGQIVFVATAVVFNARGAHLLSRVI